MDGAAIGGLSLLQREFTDDEKLGNDLPLKDAIRSGANVMLRVFQRGFLSRSSDRIPFYDFGV